MTVHLNCTDTDGLKLIVMQDLFSLFYFLIIFNFDAAPPHWHPTETGNHSLDWLQKFTWLPLIKNPRFMDISGTTQVWARLLDG